MKIQRIPKTRTELDAIALERLKVGNDETKGLIQLEVLVNGSKKKTTALRTYKGVQIDENTVQCWKKDTMESGDFV